MEDAIELGYVAGIIDGEGSIMLVAARHESFMQAQGRRYPAYYPNIRVGMVKRVSLDRICSFMKMGKVAQEKSYAGKRPMHRYRLTRKEDVYNFLKRISPYLSEKKEQAELLLEYIENNPRCSHINPVTPEIEEWRHSYWVKIRSLNGIASPATTEPYGKRGRSKGVRVSSDSLNL